MNQGLRDIVVQIECVAYAYRDDDYESVDARMREIRSLANLARREIERQGPPPVCDLGPEDADRIATIRAATGM